MSSTITGDGASSGHVDTFSLVPLDGEIPAGFLVGRGIGAVGGGGTLLRAIGTVATSGDGLGSPGGLQIPTGEVIEDGLVGRGPTIIGLGFGVGMMAVRLVLWLRRRMRCSRGPERNASGPVRQIGWGWSLGGSVGGGRMAADDGR